MNETISEKTDYLLKVQGPKLMKEKFPGISIEMPSDELSEHLIYEHIQDGWSYDRIIESIPLIKKPGDWRSVAYPTMKKKHGEQVALQLLKAQQDGELTEELFDSIVGVGEAKNTESVKASYSAGTANNDKQYIRLWFENIDDPEFKKLFKGRYLTYAVLRRYIMRNHFKYDHLNLYENYFLKGKLASSCSIGWLATRFGSSPNTIRNHLNELRKIGCIKRDEVLPKEAWDNQFHYIYIFGVHDGDRNEKFFIDEVFGIPPIPDGQGVQ